jgi:small subunit ribosomal protein S16
MVIIRLARGGTNKRPFYHIVVTDSRNPRDGRSVERLGFFNPIATGGEKRLLIMVERVQHWLSKGAQISDRVAKLMKDYAKLSPAEASAV